MNAPFAIRSLSVLAYAQGFTLWHYKATGTQGDLLSDVRLPGFFDPAVTMVAAGDMILVSAADGATVVAVSDIHEPVTVAPLS